MADKPLCGADKKQTEGTCENIAGFRTDHPGSGRCYLHGGRSPIKHGMYSKIEHSRLGELVAAHRENPDPFNLLPELALLRAILEDLVERWESIYGPDGALLAWHESYKLGEMSSPKPRQLPDFASLSSVADRVGGMVERIQRLRREQSLSVVTLHRVVEQLGAEVVEAIRDVGCDQDTTARLLEVIEGRWARVAVEPVGPSGRGASPRESGT